jgi:gentisate 1,2-dioxygenase
VRKASELKFVDGPQAYSRHYVEPKDGISQLFHIHLEEYGPGGKSQKHGHVNEAAFYILDGKGYEVHDGIRYDWKAGDVAIVHNNCVHQHFNADPNKPARALVMKTKPMYLFMNMLFQKQVEPRHKEPTPEGVGFEPREEEQDYNHPEGGY